MYSLSSRVKNRRPVSPIKILALAFLLSIAIYLVARIFHVERYFFKGPQTIVQLITNTGLKSTNNRVNVLLLGIGGEGHEGPDLTDTIILASIDKSGKDPVIISIPRDLWAPGVGAKINAAYAFGQEKNGKGLELAKNTVSQLFDIPIHYAARIDFDGFIKAVDLTGGLDVTVDTPFTDYKYPIADHEDDLCGLTIETQEKDGKTIQVVKDATGSAVPLEEISEENDPFTCRYETISFTQGSNLFDGTTTLKFVRSRHGTNGEGSDFARSARQEKIINAFRTKVMSTQTFLDPQTILGLVKTFSKSIDTDITSDDVPYFVKLAKNAQGQETRRIILDSDQENSLLEIGNSADYGGQFALIPKGGSWTNLAESIQAEIFKNQQEKPDR